MSVWTVVGVGIVLMMAVAALVGEWAGILAFAIALLMVFELDLYNVPDDRDGPTGDSL